MWSMPSGRYRPATGTVRSPPGPPSRTEAPTTMAAGARSVDDTAQHCSPLGATQHTSPPAFRHGPAAARHSSVTLMKLHRVSTQRLPPTVAGLRVGGDGTD